jgi:hypothetical protein
MPSPSTMQLIELTRDQVVAIASVAATVLVGIGSWFISAYYAKKSLRNEELSYRMKMTPLLGTRLFKEADKLEIKYKGEIIDQLVFLEVDVVNTGNLAIKNPPIKITGPGATYVIPACLEDVPEGYDSLWELEREDGETCLVKADHINPGQTLKARFLMDSMPPCEPSFACPVADLRLRRIKDMSVSPVATTILEAFYPALAKAVRALTG